MHNHSVQPPPHTFHTPKVYLVTDMMVDYTDYKLWCLIEGAKEPFSVVTPSSSSISRLKQLIYAKPASEATGYYRACDLILRKVCHGIFMPAGITGLTLRTILQVDADFNDINDSVCKGTYQPENTQAETIIEPVWQQLFHIWSTPPLSHHLHIFISLHQATGE